MEGLLIPVGRPFVMRGLEPSKPSFYRFALIFE